MTISYGPLGFSSFVNSNGEERGPSCPYNNECYSATCTTSGTSCTIGEPFCQGIFQYFIGVSSSSGCPYTLEVTPRVEVTILEEDVELCSVVDCVDHWLLSDSTGNTILTNYGVTVTVSNNDDVNSLEVRIEDENVATASCSISSSCPPSTICTYQIDCHIGEIYVAVSAISSDDCDSSNDCSGIAYSIFTTLTAYNVQTISVGSSVTSDYAILTTNGLVLMNGNFAYSTTGFSVLGGCTQPCSTFTLGSTSGPVTYYFYQAQGLVISNLPSLPAVTSTFSQVTLSSTYTHFTVTPPAGVNSFTLEFEDVSYCRCGQDNNRDFSLYLTVSAFGPSFGCQSCTGGSLLSTNPCQTFPSFTYSCTPSVPHYFTISSCDFDSLVCPISFRVRATFSSSRTLIGGNHNAAFTTVSSTGDCGSTASSFGFYTVVSAAESILSVSLKEPHGFPGVGASVTITPANLPTEVCSSSSCSVVDTSVGVSTSCQLGDSICELSCASPGTYFIDVSISNPSVSDPSQVAVQVVNQYIELSGSTTGSIIGDTKHFYRISNAASAVSISFNIVSGPPVILTLYDTCNDQTEPLFFEQQVCAFGTCRMWIPSLAKHSLSPTFYFTIESSTIGSDDSSNRFRNRNVDAEKSTDYTISVVLGSANCAAPPTTGFCSNATIEGVNVWSDITSSSVWSFVQPQWKDEEARCRFNSLSSKCPVATPECRRWLKIFSCLESFPQCDGSGFQLGTCRSVCEKVVEVCGFWTDGNGPQYTCCSDRYVDVVGNSTAGSTCYNIPPPPPPPPAIDPVFGDPSSEFPPSIDAPDFTTIYAYIPPFSQFVKEAEVQREVIVGSGYSIAPLLALLSIVFLLL